MLVIASCVLSCSHKDSKQTNPVVPASVKNIPTNCKQFSPVADIWKLEPILLKNGQIQENMSKAEKEVLIRQYIHQKNQQYKICLKGGNQPSKKGKQ